MRNILSPRDIFFIKKRKKWENEEKIDVFPQYQLWKFINFFMFREYFNFFCDSLEDFLEWNWIPWMFDGCDVFGVNGEWEILVF